MGRRRFFVEEIRGGQAVLRGEEARHLVRVLRAEIGQRFEISDNQSVYLAEIDALGKDRVSFRALEPVAPEELAVRITLFASLIKFDRFEWLLEKATELGIERIVPVQAERSEKGLRLAAAKRLERWRKIVRESSQQSRRAHLPEVCPPIPFAEAAGSAAPHRFFLEEQSGAPPILAALPLRCASSGPLALLIGPEGGWTNDERMLAAREGWTPVSLGPQILRAETAAIAALAILTSAWLARPHVEPDPDEQRVPVA